MNQEDDAYDFKLLVQELTQDDPVWVGQALEACFARRHPHQCVIAFLECSDGPRIDMSLKGRRVQFVACVEGRDEVVTAVVVHASVLAFSGRAWNYIMGMVVGGRRRPRRLK
jgi:hypothetical protein